MPHNVKMILGCVLSLLLIFIFPLLGFGAGIKLFLVIVAVFACHYYMLGGSHDHDEDKKDE